MDPTTATVITTTAPTLALVILVIVLAWIDRDPK